jgi:IS1 family transposase
MNKLTPERRAAVIRCLVEGNSIRATVRMTGAAKNTVAKLLVELGYACSEYQDRVLRNLNCQRVQCDEIWSFVGCKEKNVPEEKKGSGECGDVWTWTALDADTKLAVSWRVGGRDAETACDFMHDVADRLASRIQLTTDGHNCYLMAVEEAFGGAVDYAMLVKLYGEDSKSEKRYSPPVCIAAKMTPVSGDPNPKHVSTSFVERQNLTMRMSIRRFTRLTNAFSKKIENHACAVSLHFMYYNFARPHKSLNKPYPTTPAMAAGVTDHVWDISEIVALLSN